MNEQVNVEVEDAKATEAISKLPIAQKPFYVAHYQIYGSKPAGTFVGLVCKYCNRWAEYGHDDKCPVANLGKV